MLGVVVDARHHIRSAEALGIFEGGVGDQFAGFQVEQAQDDGGGAQVHGKSEAGAGNMCVEKRKSGGLALNAHVAAPHGVAADRAIGGDAGAAR